MDEYDSLRKNNDPFGYLDDNTMAGLGFHVPTHRIIKIPYGGGGGYGRGRRLGLGLGLGLSLSLHLLLLFSSKYPIVTDAAHSTDTRKQEVMQVELVNQKSLDQLAGESFRLPEIIYSNPKAELEPETQYIDPNKNYNRLRSLDIIMPNSSLDTKLRDMILTGKSPGESYTDAKLLSKEDYNDFLLLYLKTYLELKRNPLLVTRKTIDDNKVDLVLHFITQVKEDGKINLLQYGQSPNLTRLESDILNDALTHLKRIPNFIPPSKANLKAPHQLQFWYYVTYKTWAGADLPVEAKKLTPVR